MLNKEKHQLIMGQILRDIYSDNDLISLLGFKGGTCAYLFYDLPRFSVDLDFDLLEFERPEVQEIVFEKIKSILLKYGKLQDECNKEFTILFQLTYGEGDRNLKIEINTRQISSEIKSYYEIKEYLGISMLVAKKNYLFAGKLAALLGRRKPTMRDIFDVYYFASNNWDIDTEFLESWTEKKINKYLDECIEFIEKIGDKQILQGLGELVDESQKTWIKEGLRSETVFLLKSYQWVLGSK